MRSTAPPRSIHVYSYVYWRLWYNPPLHITHPEILSAIYFFPLRCQKWHKRHHCHIYVRRPHTNEETNIKNNTCIFNYRYSLLKYWWKKILALINEKYQFQLGRPLPQSHTPLWAFTEHHPLTSSANDWQYLCLIWIVCSTVIMFIMSIVVIGVH